MKTAGAYLFQFFHQDVKLATMKFKFRWLKDHSDAIGSLAAIAGVIIGIVGFWFTITQLSATERTLRASNSYQIQSDARELVGEIVLLPIVKRAFDGEELSLPELQIFREALWRMHNFYLSVYRQDRAQGLSQDFVTAFTADFCAFVSIEIVANQWDEMLNSNMLSQQHNLMRSTWCD